MTKQEQFLYVVQTTILANGINLSLEEDAKADRDLFSASGVLGLMRDVIWASERIPERMSAVDAADEFCTFMLRNLRELEEKAEGKPMQVPAWFARS